MHLQKWPLALQIIKIKTGTIRFHERSKCLRRTVETGATKTDAVTKSKFYFIMRTGSHVTLSSVCDYYRRRQLSIVVVLNTELNKSKFTRVSEICAKNTATLKITHLLLNYKNRANNERLIVGGHITSVNTTCLIHDRDSCFESLKTSKLNLRLTLA